MILSYSDIANVCIPPGFKGLGPMISFYLGLIQQQTNHSAVLQNYFHWTVAHGNYSTREHNIGTNNIFLRRSRTRDRSVRPVCVFCSVATHIYGVFHSVISYFQDVIPLVNLDEKCYSNILNCYRVMYTASWKTGANVLST
jgi:hypothetical protein